MKNFQNLAIESVNGVMNVSAEEGKLYPNSLVLVNKSGKRGVNFVTKARSTDPRAVVKALLRAVVETQRWALQENSTESATATKRKVINPLSAGMSGTRIWVTNSKGQVISQAAFTTTEGVTLRQLFKITPSNPLYTLVIENGKAWSDIAVAEALRQNVERTFELLGAMQRFDEVIEVAAKANAAEDKSEEAKELPVDNATDKKVA